MIERTSRVRQGMRVAYRDLQQGGVVLHLDTGEYHRLNHTGRLIWSNLAGSTVAELLDRIRGEFQQPPPDLDEDVLEFLQALLDRGLIEVGGADPARASS